MQKWYHEPKNLQKFGNGKTKKSHFKWILFLEWYQKCETYNFMQNGNKI